MADSKAGNSSATFNLRPPGDSPDPNKELWPLPFATSKENASSSRAFVLSSRDDSGTIRILHEPPPQQIGDYEILEALGHGGMGVVYKARHRELGRIVALKMVMQARFASVEDLLRFRLEGEAAARLHHPNIVQVHEVGSYQGQPFLVLEFVEGGTLRENLGGRPPHPREGARLIEVLARAAHAAHLQGIVHRDLKPGNVLLQPQEQGSDHSSSSSPYCVSSCFASPVIPKITDFGLAKQINQDSDLTETGCVLGTPQYMAPEQAAGRSCDIGPPTDVYALGVMLYELLVGRTPFHATDSADTMLQLLSRDPVAPRRVDRKVPADLETICLKCLEKEPSKRYASAQDLAEDLRRFREGKPIRARPVGFIERCWKWARRHPVIAGLVASLVLVSILGFGGVSLALVYALEGWSEAALQSRMAEAGLHAAESERTTAQKERDKAQQAQRRETEARERAEQAHTLSETQVAFNRLARTVLEWKQNNLHASRTLLGEIDPTKRGWEWRYLQGLHQGELLTVSRPVQVSVLGLAFRPDGRQLASVGGNAYARKPDGQIASEVAIWDVTSGKLQRALRGFRYLAHKVAYSSDGTRLAACSDDATVQIWESDTGRLVRVLRGGSSIRALGWNHTGNRLYASTFRGGTFGWDVETGQRLPRLPDTSDESLFLAVSPNSRHLATRPSQGGVGVWDLNTRKLLWTKTRIPHAVTFSPDNQLLACAVGELVRLHAVADGRQVCSFGGHEGPVLGVAFSPCGQLLATGGADSTVRIWDVEEGRVLSVWRGHLGRVETVAFHPHGAIVASGSAQPGEIKLWDLTRPQGHIPCARPTRGGRVETLSFAPEGHEIILARSTGIVERRDATTDVLRSSRWMPLGGFWRVPATLTAFSQDTRLLAGVSREENTVCVWNTQTGEALAGKYRHSVPAWFVAMSQQGQLVASGAFAIRDAELLSELAVWESATGQVRLRCKDVRVRVACLALTVDGKQLARCLIRLRKETDPTMIRFVPTDAVVEVWDVPAVGQAVPTAPRLSFRPADSMIRGLAFSCDGTMLAGSSDEGTLFLWDLAAGQPLHPRALPGPNMLEGLAFSPDGKLIAGVSRTEVAIWNVREGQEVLRLRGAPPRPSDGGFSPRIAWSNDGRRLAASNWDQSVSIWDTTDLKNPQMMQDRHSAALARLPGWHIDHAMRAWTRRQPTATHFHLAQIDRLGQLDPGWCLLRGEVYAQMGEWKKALADLDRGMTVVESPQGDLSRKHLLLRRMNGDHDGYQKGCAVLAEHLSHRIEASFLPQAVYTCVAAAESNVDPKVLVEVMREVTKKQQKSAWHHHVLALSCLRAKNYDESVTASQRSLALKPEESTRITTWLTLALAEHHRGNREEAQKWKTRAHDWIAVQRQVLAASNRQVPDAMSWCDWLVVQLLVREVEQTLEAA